MNEHAPVLITVGGDAPEYLKKISDPARVLKALARTMDQQNQLTVALIKRDYLSFPRSGPTVPDGLRKVSGRYEQSLRASRARFGEGFLESSIGSNVVSKDGESYPASHEFGCFVPSRPTRAKNKYYARKHPATKAFTLPARSPIQRGIKDRLDQYSQAFGETILKM
jgi:hypothetical protein